MSYEPIARESTLGVYPRMRSQASVIRKRIATLEMELARLAELPAEPQEEPENGCVIWFEKSFNMGRPFTYAAVKAGNGFWYTTGGKDVQAYTWERLVDWIGDGPIWFATEWNVIS